MDLKDAGPSKIIKESYRSSNYNLRIKTPININSPSKSTTNFQHPNNPLILSQVKCQ